MRGYRVERRLVGIHGLPIEMSLARLSGWPPSKIWRRQFNEACRENVLTYTKEWEKTVERLGRVDFKNDYRTMDPEFMSRFVGFSQL